MIFYNRVIITKHFNFIDPLNQTQIMILFLNIWSSNLHRSVHNEMPIEFKLNKFLSL